MWLRRLRTLDDLDEAPQGEGRWPLSQLYHLNSALGPFSRRSFARQVLRYGDREVRDGPRASGKRYPGRPTIALPPPPRRGGGRLRRLLGRRRTRRDFDGRALDRKTLGALLGLGGGVTAEVEVGGGRRLALRAWPSGGALYPLELYWCDLGLGASLSAGVYHYCPEEHLLERVSELSPERLLSLLYVDNFSAAGAAGALVVSAVWARTQRKYGERGYRVVLLDAGHLGQNLLLLAEDLGLNAVALGGFDDLAFCEPLEIERWQEESVVHAVLVGQRPRQGLARFLSG